MLRITEARIAGAFNRRHRRDGLAPGAERLETQLVLLDDRQHAVVDQQLVHGIVELAEVRLDDAPQAFVGDIAGGLGGQQALHRFRVGIADHSRANRITAVVHQPPGENAQPARQRVQRLFELAFEFRHHFRYGQEFFELLLVDQREVGQRGDFGRRGPVRQRVAEDGRRLAENFRDLLANRVAAPAHGVLRIREERGFAVGLRVAGRDEHGVCQLAHEFVGHQLRGGIDEGRQARQDAAEFGGETLVRVGHRFRRRICRVQRGQPLEHADGLRVRILEGNPDAAGNNPAYEQVQLKVLALPAHDQREIQRGPVMHVDEAELAFIGLDEHAGNAEILHRAGNRGPAADGNQRFEIHRDAGVTPPLLTLTHAGLYWLYKNSVTAGDLLLDWSGDVWVGLPRQHCKAL